MKKLLPLFISAALGSMSTSAWADSLAEIYDLAKQNDPQLLSVAAQRDQAFEAINSSRSALLPQINLTAGYDIARGETDYDKTHQSSEKTAITTKMFFLLVLDSRKSYTTVHLGSP